MNVARTRDGFGERKGLLERRRGALDTADVRFALVAAAMFIMSLARPLGAEVLVEPFVQFTFSGTPPCLDPGLVRGDVESRLGRAVFRDRGAPYALSVEKDPGSRSLRITLQNQLTGEVLGTRELTDTQACDEYQAILPVVVTVLLEPYVRDREARSGEQAPSEPSLQTDQSDSQDAPTERARPIPPDFRCGLSGGAIVGFTPRASAVGRQACTLRIPPKYDVDLSIGYRFPGTSSEDDLSFALQAVELRLALCRGFGARVRFGACAGASLAGTIARTSAGGQAQPDDFRVIGELSVFGRVDYEFSSLGFLRFDAGLFAPLARPVYTYQEPLGSEPTRLHQASFVAGNLEIGAGFHWW